MPTAVRSSRWAQLLVSLVVGTALAAAIWLSGHPQSGWLGFATAAMLWPAGRTYGQIMAVGGLAYIAAVAVLRWRS